MEFNTAYQRKRFASPFDTLGPKRTECIFLSQRKNHLWHQDHVVELDRRRRQKLYTPAWKETNEQKGDEKRKELNNFLYERRIRRKQYKKVVACRCPNSRDAPMCEMFNLMLINFLLIRTMNICWQQLYSRDNMGSRSISEPAAGDNGGSIPHFSKHGCCSGLRRRQENGKNKKLQDAHLFGGLFPGRNASFRRARRLNIPCPPEVLKQ